MRRSTTPALKHFDVNYVQGRRDAKRYEAIRLGMKTVGTAIRARRTKIVKSFHDFMSSAAFHFPEVEAAQRRANIRHAPLLPGGEFVGEFGHSFSAS